MSQISVNQMSFCYEGSYDDIFKDVTLTLDSDWKLGFVGRNGRGKTTFLKLLMGQLDCRGSIWTSVEFEYFPYPVEDKSRITHELVESILPDYEFWQLCRELSLMAVDSEVLFRPFETLSSGEQTKVLLAVLFLRENHFLLIDEPTNHLDMEARETVGEYLRRKKGFILVSHDRAFLDRSIDHMLSINKTGMEVVAGNFSSWWDNKERRAAFELQENERLKKDISRLTEAARRAENWSDQVEKTKIGTRVAGLRPDRGHIGHKSAKMMKRAKVTERRMLDAAEEKSTLLKNVETAADLKLFPLVHHKKELVRIESAALGYGEREVLKDFTLTVRAGEKVVLRGRNGCGKSTVLKSVLEMAGLKEGIAVSEDGRVSLASGLVVSYVPQDTSFLRGPLSAFMESHRLDETLFKALLRKLDFARTQFEKPMEAYSAGQKKKVLLAKSLSEQAHLYLWDEPLNYIDIFSRMQLERLLRNTELTMLLVEHDRAFVEGIADRMIEL